MFPRSLRLGRHGFEQSRGLSRTTTPHLTISYGVLPNDAGIGVIVPKKVLKSAVDRHRLKRRLRELLRGRGVPGKTIIVVARTGAGALTYDELESELSHAFRDILPETASA